MSKYKEDIIKLRNQGLSYNKICEILGCSKSLVAYHSSAEYRQKTVERKKKYRKSHPYFAKTETFIYPRYYSGEITPKSSIKKQLYDKVRKFQGNKMSKATFDFKDVITKFGENPICYLTGQPIDIYKPRSYNFDHIIPKSRGGDNSLDNLGICTKQANQSKRDMTPDEFINLCKQVLSHNGYNIIKK